jgi:glycosyltransferase involved in cell wall biosynthesis
VIRATEPTDGGDIVYARRLDADANLESLLLALAELRTSDWSATVIGDGPARAAYERQAADLRIDDRVAFTGTLSREQRVARYRGAHAFVHTARRTPFATELLWALASGCTGVVEYHAESSAHELVEARERGFLATGGDELVDCLRGAAGLARRDIDEEFAAFDEERVADRYLDAY